MQLPQSDTDMRWWVFRLDLIGVTDPLISVSRLWVLPRFLKFGIQFSYEKLDAILRGDQSGTASPCMGPMHSRNAVLYARGRYTCHDPVTSLYTLIITMTVFSPAMILLPAYIPSSSL